MTQVLSSQGFYFEPTGASYFWKQANLARDLRVAFHETTHQALKEFMGSDNAPTWVKESAAVYMEYVRWEDEKITTRPWAMSVWNRSFVLEKSRMPVKKLTSVSDADFNGGAERLQYYANAGGFTDFLMNGQGGTYRGGFLEFLHESYKNKGAAPLNEFLGVDMATLETQWAAYHAATFVGIEAKVRADAAKRGLTSLDN
jgi:hypothetical protein